MGDLTDSLFQRQCSLGESTEDREWLGKGGGEITVLEIGGQRRFGKFEMLMRRIHDKIESELGAETNIADTHHITSPQELRQYVDLQNQSDDEDLDSCWHESSNLKPRSLKLL